MRAKIDSLKNGINTYIDKIYENDGVLLSGGESQRVAIAQAFYKDAPVIILDEPTASLDARVEAEIYTKFDEITADKTAIYITHRLASILRTMLSFIICRLSFMLIQRTWTAKTRNKNEENSDSNY